MSRRRVGTYLIWAVLAGCLYFFENGTGTRTVLFCTLLLPLVPFARKALFGPDRDEKPVPAEKSVRAVSTREADEPGDVRAYLPGDPVNRIHWKLSAKRDELLVRDRERETAEENARELSGGAVCARSERNGRKRLALAAAAFAAVMILLLFLIPEANRGLCCLLNRLFEASEKMNAYAYVRFPVLQDQPAGLATLLLIFAAAALLFAAAVSGSRSAALGILTASVAFQIYFGLPLPGWANVLLFAWFALRTAARPTDRRTAAGILALILVGSAAVLLVWPGTDAGTEALSELARDRLARSAPVTGILAELPEGTEETRHAHTQSLVTGEGPAVSRREFRLVTAEQEQISMPHWVDYLRIALLLLLTAAVVILPFLPFVWLNARRRKGIRIRKGFQSEDVGEAVQAIFQHTVAWLETTGNGAGNVPYRDWTGHLAERISGEYALRFAPCAKLFEEAAYSGHTLSEEQRRQALELLDETQRTLLGKADWKQKLRLRYGECLWI